MKMVCMAGSSEEIIYLNENTGEENGRYFDRISGQRDI